MKSNLLQSFVLAALLSTVLTACVTVPPPPAHSNAASDTHNDGKKWNH